MSITSRLKVNQHCRRKVALPDRLVHLDIERMARYYIGQLLIPLILIVAMSWNLFWINPEVIPTRIGTCVTVLLEAYFSAT